MHLDAFSSTSYSRVNNRNEESTKRTFGLLKILWDTKGSQSLNCRILESCRVLYHYGGDTKTQKFTPAVVSFARRNRSVVENSSAFKTGILNSSSQKRNTIQVYKKKFFVSNRVSKVTKGKTENQLMAVVCCHRLCSELYSTAR